MEWKELMDVSRLESLKEESKTRAVGIFKHSTRCSISATALDRLERSWDKLLPPVTPYFLDLIAHREISNTIAEVFKVEHESPQFILIKDGQVVYHDSHYGIDLEEIILKAQ